MDTFHFGAASAGVVFATLMLLLVDLLVGGAAPFWA